MRKAFLIDERSFGNEGKSGTTLTALHEGQNIINNSLWKIDMQAPSMISESVRKPCRGRQAEYWIFSLRRSLSSASSVYRFLEKQKPPNPMMCGQAKS